MTNKLTFIYIFLISGSLSSSEKRQQGHPLKSFSVPAPPPQSAPSTPQQKHIGMTNHFKHKMKSVLFITIVYYTYFVLF